MLKISFKDDTDRKLIQTLEEKGPAIIQVLATKLNALMLQLSRYVVTQKLQGQVLHQRSGKLAGSIRALPVELTGTTIVGAVEGAGGPAWYGTIHEFGGVFDVKERALARMKRGSHRTGFMAHAVFKGGHVVFPARPFMNPSLTENAEMIEQELKLVLDEELAK